RVLDQLVELILDRTNDPAFLILVRREPLKTPGQCFLQMLAMLSDHRVRRELREPEFRGIDLREDDVDSEKLDRSLLVGGEQELEAPHIRGAKEQLHSVRPHVLVDDEIVVTMRSHGYGWLRLGFD